MADPTIAKKEYRKPYILTEGGYQDMMRSTWDKSIWNDILEVDPVWAEFLFTRAELPDAATAAEVRYLRYLKQSEFKKHYLNGLDYQEMEYLWTGPIPGFLPPDFGWDFPWRPIEGGGVYTGDPEESPPFTAICDADSDGCYCPGQSKDVTITATYPITGIEFVFGEGEYVSEYQGIGTNEIIATIVSPEGRSGQMRIRVWMQLANGSECDSEINIYECDEEDCCPECDLAWDTTTSDETLVAPGTANVYITGGTPPFKWEISSEDGLWTLGAAETEARANTVDAAAGACGSATITVTDACDCTAEGSIRNPSNGSWTRTCGPTIFTCCALPGVQATAECAIGLTMRYVATQGKYRSKQSVSVQFCYVTGYTSESECLNNIDICCGPSGTSCSQVGLGGAIGAGVNVKTTCQYINFTPCLTLDATHGAFTANCGGGGANVANRIEGSNYYRTDCLFDGTYWNVCHICYRDCASGGCCNGTETYEWRC